MTTHSTYDSRWPALLALSFLFGGLGAAVGRAFGLTFTCLPLHPVQFLLCSMCWTAMGAVQGACVLPAWALGRREPLGGFAALICGFGSAMTSLLAILLFFLAGRSAHTALWLAAGLCLLGVFPLCGYLSARRRAGYVLGMGV